MLNLPARKPIRYIHELKSVTKDYRELTERVKRQIAALNKKKEG